MLPSSSESRAQISWRDLVADFCNRTLGMLAFGIVIRSAFLFVYGEVVRAPVVVYTTRSYVKL